jgi:mycothiol synthase
LTGFCVLARSPEAWYADLVTDPDARCRGVGTALLLAAHDHVTSHGGGLLRCWGSQPGAPAALARKIGMTALRSLHFQRLRLPVDQHPPPRPPPTDVRVRMLRNDESAAWLQLSNAAFLGHPENGGWTMTDLQWRLAATWTDLTRFPVAVDSDDQLLAGVWTKAEPGAADAELYVVAVHPRHGGRGLGELVVREALHALRAAGSTVATLYVDDDNTRARALYDRISFRTHHLDHCYQVDITRQLS